MCYYFYPEKSFWKRKERIFSVCWTCFHYFIVVWRKIISRCHKHRNVMIPKTYSTTCYPLYCVDDNTDQLKQLLWNLKKWNKLQTVSLNLKPSYGEFLPILSLSLECFIIKVTDLINLSTLFIVLFPSRLGDICNFCYFWSGSFPRYVQQPLGRGNKTLVITAQRPLTSVQLCISLCAYCLH